MNANKKEFKFFGMHHPWWINNTKEKYC